MEVQLVEYPFNPKTTDKNELKVKNKPQTVCMSEYWS